MGKELTLDRVELFIRQFDKANGVFSEAITTVTEEEAVERRKELLEQALVAYAEILTLLPRTDSWNIRLIRRTVLDKIHAVEAMIEQEIERSVSCSSSGNSNNSNSGSSNGSNTISKIEEALTEARLSLQAID